MHKRVLLIIGIVLCSFFGCDYSADPDDPWLRCKDGIQNYNETGIDCGGDCKSCFECMTTYCTILSGATTFEDSCNIKWTYVYGSNQEIDYWIDGWTDKEYSYVFWNNGIYYRTADGVTEGGYWDFDDSNAPTELRFTNHIPFGGWGEYNTQSLYLLLADSLIFQYKHYKYWDEYVTYAFVREQ